MPSVFAGLEDGVSDQCDAMFGEMWTLLPMMDSAGGGRRVSDAARAEVVFAGIFSAPNKRSTEFGVEARGTNPRYVEETWISIDERQIPGDRPRRYDRVRRHDTGQVYELSHGERDGERRFKFWVKEIVGA